MLPQLKRLGPFQRRSVLPILLLLLIGVVAVIVGTLDPRTNALELVIQPLPPDTMPPARIVGDSTIVPGQPPRLAVPLLLGLRNAGPGAARPGTLELFVPLRYRLRVRYDDLDRVRAVLLHGDPMLRYDFTLDAPVVPADSEAVVIARPDTVWLVPVDVGASCLVGLDSVPQFSTSADPRPPAADTLELFYALEGGSLGGRRTGLASIPIEEILPPRPASPAVAASGVLVGTPRLPWPQVGQLRRVGVTRSYCGELEDPQPITVTLWRTPAGGRVFGLVAGDEVRKYVYDLNGDGSADLELWDPDGDGEFEAQRQTGFTIPVSFYPQPAPTPPPPRVAQRPDTAGFPVARPGDSAVLGPMPPLVGAPGRDTATVGPRPPAGQQGQPSVTPQPQPTPPVVEPEPEPAPPPPPPARQGPPLLGEPVDTTTVSPPGTGVD